MRIQKYHTVIWVFTYFCTDLIYVEPRDTYCDAITVWYGNENYGIIAGNSSTIHLRGEATAIHSNGGGGISAFRTAKVIIHLPSHHNTSYNNTEEDRYTERGGTITNVED